MIGDEDTHFEMIPPPFRPINPDGTPVSGDNIWVDPDVNTGGSVESAGFFSWIKGLFR